jgi:tetratricopeptide (TPR) repeat protein
VGVDEADRFIAEGHFLEDGGDPGAALERYRESAAIAPEHPRAYLNIGNALRKLERGDEASAAYRHALRIAPHYVQARFNLAGLLAEQGDFATALTELTKALCDDPGLDSARILFADMLEATGRVDLAERELREAMKTGSEPGGAALNLGHLLLRANRFVEAEECMLQARSLDPVRCADALSSYCFALNLRGDLPAEAIFRSHQRIGSERTRPKAPNPDRIRLQ